MDLGQSSGQFSEILAEVKDNLVTCKLLDSFQKCWLPALAKQFILISSRVRVCFVCLVSRNIVGPLKSYTLFFHTCKTVGLCYSLISARAMCVALHFDFEEVLSSKCNNLFVYLNNKDSKEVSDN